MSVMDEALADSDSFYEVGQYKRTVRRVDDGLKLCHQLMSLTKERGEIEAAYAKALDAWARKWTDTLEKSPEYGTMEAATKGVFQEASKRAGLHRDIQDRLNSEVHTATKTFSKDTFHKATIGGLKESKDFDENFKKAQKPWAKLYGKVDKTKKEYHGACKAEASAINHEKNAANDPAMSQEQVSKLTQKVDKCKEDKEKAKEAYTNALDGINSYNPKYMEDMMIVFENCQELELKRFRFFKEALLRMHACLDLSKDPKLGTIYDEYMQTIQSAEPNKDLTFWAVHHGPSMPMKWPEFVEYSPKLRPLHKKERVGSKQIPDDGVHLRRLEQTDVTNHHAVSNGPSGSSSHISSSGGGSWQRTALLASNVVSSSPSSAEAKSAPVRPPPPLKQQMDSLDFADFTPTPPESTSVCGDNGPTQSTNAAPSMPPPPVPNGGAMNASGGGSPYDEDWDSRRGTMIDTGESGVPVRALYDYEAQEGDELSFKKGEEFEKLEDEDEMGWCKGRIGKRVGLYPANYVEPI